MPESTAGNPTRPSGITGVSTTETEGFLSISFTRTDVDTAKVGSIEHLTA